MAKRVIDISRLIMSPAFKRFDEAGLIDRIALRNMLIREEFRQLRKSMNRTEALSRLMDKYFLGYDSIFSIVYRNRK